jgi:hypothetical protein
MEAGNRESPIGDRAAGSAFFRFPVFDFRFPANG